MINETNFMIDFLMSFSSYVSLGEHNLLTSPDCAYIKDQQICAPKEQRMSVEKVMIHPSYNHPCRECNDIGLIRFTEAAVLDDSEFFLIYNSQLFFNKKFS